ncbi:MULTISPECIES: class I SAM-dependent methyltransferase [unclassified Paenibacillus]|uniref:class I SAM-dependent methyltransferase n=1 Tax=unclassified Paenibacillus TaxID=185978 RepID=UPI0036C9799D
MLRGLKERLLFLYKFLQAPLSTGNIVPSSRRLAQALLEPIPWEQVNSLAELGAGTGAVTRHLPSAQQPMQVLLFEKDPELRRRLKLRFPDYRFYPDSSRLRLALHNGKLEKLDCIVSGLPFWSMGSEKRMQLLSQISASLKDEGMFVVFSYYFKQIQKDLKPFFDIQRSMFVPLNFPPAVVYVCRKKANADSEKKVPWLSVVAAKDSRVLLER